MANREREIQLKFRVTPEERELIEAKMAQLGTQNMAAYLRKMALDGYVVRLELPELREMVALLRRSSNNLNQLTRRVHETGRIYDADLEDLRQGQEKDRDDVMRALIDIQYDRNDMDFHRGTFRVRGGGQNFGLPPRFLFWPHPCKKKLWPLC